MTARRTTEERPARLSYVTAAVSGALILALVGYLVVQAVRADEPAQIAAEVVAGEGWTRNGVAYVPVDVMNLGDQAAAQVVIETEAPGAAGPQTATIDYLAGGERQRIYVALSASADPADMTARAVTFQEP
ncbi:MAG TPA: hypothetical protein VM737_11320 [Gemmatimonadota bacterium]|nr:hypothetical protein [Gemmatimonadota bacterium]